MNHKTRIGSAFILAALALPVGAIAQQAPELEPEQPDNENERGWFWGFWSQFVDEKPDDKEEEEKEEPVVVAPSQEERDCTDPGQWQADCGFVDPDGDFDFQAAQRDALLEDAVMNPSDTNKVKQWQKYQRWVTDQALEMSQVWQWNLMQNQELNPTAASPVAAFGIRAANSLRKSERKNAIEAINDQGGFLFWFTRDECVFCHEMAEPLYHMKERNNLEMYAASLDGVCPEHFEDACETGDLVIQAARHLNVDNVPDIWLHLPKDDLWFRVSTGIEATTVILSRIELFFGAITRAAEKGLENAPGSINPNVDFSPKDLMKKSRGGLGRGVTHE